MKYLKNYRIFESNYPLIKDIDNFFKENLAYVMDLGLDVKVEPDDTTIGEYIGVIQGFDQAPFNYDEIKYDFISFLILLDDKYILNHTIIFFDANDDFHDISFNDIIDDKINIKKIRSIDFYISDKK